jgi:hypothetical protein
VSNTTFQFDTNPYSWDTTTLPDGTYGMVAIAWDPTGLVKEGVSANVTIMIANGTTTTPTPTPALSVSSAPTPTQTPAPSAGASVTGNFAATVATGYREVFGGVGLPFTSTQEQMLADNGDTMVRWAYNIYWADSINQVVPATSNSAYEAALSAGCPSGSACDPNTWAWGDDSEAQTVFQEANVSRFSTMAIMGDTTPWNSVNGTITGMPTDWTVYEDMVKKIVQHYSSLFATTYIEVWNEPDVIPISPSDYATVYYHTAHAVRSVNSSILIGGPATSSPNNSYVDAIMNNPSIPRSWVNFISFHNYNGGVGPEDTSVMNHARSLQANEPIFLTEWNADGSCQSSLDANDSATVAYDGARLINILSASYNGATHHTFEIFNPTGLCSVWDITGSYLLPRMRAALLLSKKMGLGAGNSSIKQVSLSGVTTAVAAVNSAGNPVTAVANYSGSSVTVAVNFSGLGQSGTANLQTYLADFGTNTAQSPTENMNVSVSGGSLSHSITLTPYSVAGIILSYLPPTLTPTPTSTPQSTLAPTSTPTPRPIATSSSTSAPTPSAIATSTPIAGTGAVIRANDFLNSLGVVTHDIQAKESPIAIENGFIYSGLRLGRDDATHTILRIG